MGCKGGGRDGCYGAGTIHPYMSNVGDVVGGSCVCSTGEFRDSERWKLGGRLTGLGGGGAAVQLMVTVSVPFNGGHAQRSTSWQVVTLKRDGDFQFVHRLATGHHYFVNVKKQPVSGTCRVKHARGTTSSSNVASIRVECTRFGGGGGGDGGGGANKVTDNAPAVALRQKAFSAPKLLAPDCQDSPLLYKLSTMPGLTPKEQRAENTATTLPCKREFTIHPEDKKNDAFYITELRGASCTHAEVHADQPVHACLVPAAVWYELGVTAVLRDDKLCPCKGVERCVIDKAGLSPSTTYLLFVKESKDRSKLHFHSYNDLMTSYKPVHITVYIESCAAARKKQVLEIGALALGAGLLAVLLAKGKGRGSKAGYAKIEGQELSNR